jgi:CDGSH iron-sulfur domain-containing protein 3
MIYIMARLVKKECKGPVEVKVDKTRSIRICICGLSNNQPFCDNSHKIAEDEEDNKTYAYDKQGNRIEVIDSEIFDQVMS